MLEEQEKQLLKGQIQNSKHEIFIVSFEEMDAIFKSSTVIKRPNACLLYTSDAADDL